MSEEQRWICWPDFDQVCIEGGCGFCDPFSCACGKRHTGSRMVTRRELEARARNLGIEPKWDDVRDGFVRRKVTDEDRRRARR